MKKRKFISIVGVCLLAFISLSSVSFAKQADQPVSVTYTPSSEALAKYNMKVLITSESVIYGKIYDGDIELVVGETVYNMRPGDTKSFRIVPNLTYDIAKVIYDGEDITNQLRASRSMGKEYVITIVGKDYDTDFEVTYKKIGADSSIDSSKPGKPGNSPNTGLTNNINDLLALIGISGLVILTLHIYKNREEKR